MPASAQGVQVAPGGTIVGRVTNAGTRQGILSATVQVDRTRFAAVTNEDGHYRITGVPAGSHTITARRIGYTQHSEPITVVADSELTVDFTLQPATTSLDQVIVTGTAGRRAAALDRKRRRGRSTRPMSRTSRDRRSSATC